MHKRTPSATRPPPAVRGDSKATAQQGAARRVVSDLRPPPRASSSSHQRSQSRGGAGQSRAVFQKPAPPQLPPPTAYYLQEDAENGVPQVVRSTFERLGWALYEAPDGSASSCTAPLAPPRPPPKRAQSSSTRDLAPTLPRSSWATFPPFHIHWKTNRFFISEQAACIAPYMRVNHFPWSNEITLKDTLCRNMRRMKAVYGPLLYGSLHPEGFTVPNEYLKLSEYFATQYQQHLDAKRAYAALDPEAKAMTSPPAPAIFICKPTDMSRGRKIFLFRDLSELTYDQPSIVQVYIERPLLLEGRRKVDFRVYVLVTSFHPLTAFIYHDFLSRFSALPYSESDITNSYAHLTNYSVSRTYEGSHAPGSQCVDIKWDGPTTRAYFAKHFSIDFDAVVWPRIMQAVNLTLLSVVMSPSFSPGIEAGCAAAPCFELYGFDILVDTHSFQPWVVEVNYSPSLATETPVDIRVKSKLIEDIVGVLNIPMCSGGVLTPQHHLGRAYGAFMPCFPPSVSKASTDGPTPPLTSVTSAEFLKSELHNNACYTSFPSQFVAAVELFRAASGKQEVLTAFKDLTLELRRVENGLRTRGLQAAAAMQQR